MSMITKCPACATAFRVTPQQLQAHHGMVRCGRCATVFDGFKDLATQRDVSPVDATQQAVAVHTESGAAKLATPAVTDVQLPIPEVHGGSLDPKAVPPEPAEMSGEATSMSAALTPHGEPPHSEPAISTPQGGAGSPPDPEPQSVSPRPETVTLAPEPAVATVETPSPDPETHKTASRVEAPTLKPAGARRNVQTPVPAFLRKPSLPEAQVPPLEPPVVKAEPPVRVRKAPVESLPEPPATSVAVPPESAPRRRRVGLAFAIFLLLMALAAQGAYFYRGEIAAYVPEARPYLDRICEHLRCTVALPQRPRSISIEASDLQATDTANPGLITLTATLRNHASTALGYPALDVVLTNAKEHTVARRIFLPADYLGAGRDARAGIPPNAEMTVKLDIDSGDLGAAGFRLDLLAAPGQ